MKKIFIVFLLILTSCGYQPLYKTDQNIKSLNISEVIFSGDKKILITMLPVIPHLANECLEKINEKKDIKWPIVNDKFIKNDKSNVVIQVNGKKRAVVSVEKGLDEKKILEQVKHDKLIDKYIEGKNIFKTIYVHDKILNFIIK